MTTVLIFIAALTVIGCAALASLDLDGDSNG